MLVNFYHFQHIIQALKYVCCHHLISSLTKMCTHPSLKTNFPNVFSNRWVYQLHPSHIRLKIICYIRFCTFPKKKIVMILKILWMTSLTPFKRCSIQTQYSADGSIFKTHLEMLICLLEIAQKTNSKK